MANTNKLIFDTNIAKLGVAKIPTRLVNQRFVDDTQPLTLLMTSDDLSELDSETLSMKFEKAGPRKKLYFAPANAGDRVYCGFLGQHAVHAAMAGKTGLVVTELKSSMVHLPLELVVQKRRTINIRSDYWCTVLETIGRRNYSLQ